MRVDDAESDETERRRANTYGPHHLAEVCDRNRIRLLCFSSDLVFDGASARPSLDSDDVAPLSAYGRGKADADRAIAAACPDALIARPVRSLVRGMRQILAQIATATRGARGAPRSGARTTSEPDSEEVEGS